MKIANPKLSDPRMLLIMAVEATLVLLTLLRVFSCEVRVLAYFQNYLYASALFGFGLGLLHWRLYPTDARGLGWLAPFVFVLALLVGSHFTLLANVGILREGTTFFYYPFHFSDGLIQELVATAIVFGAIWFTLLIFRGLGREVGPLIEKRTALDALLTLFAGAFISVSIYSLLLFFQAPPVVLVSVVCAIACTVAGWARAPIILTAVAVGCSLCYMVDGIPDSLAGMVDSRATVGISAWSPYYHVQTYPMSCAGRRLGTAVLGNHNPLQFMFDLNMTDDDARFLAKAGGMLTEYSRKYFDMPYYVKPNPRRVLILGAGTGNEVAAALSHGAEHIDAVDSDSLLFKIGQSHPQQPYSSPKVSRIIMDPRQFLRYSRGVYDLIIFAHIESQTAFSPFGGLRADNFSNTMDALHEARAHLAAGGYLALTYIPLRGWYGLRMAHNLYEAFDESIEVELRALFRNIVFGALKHEPLLSVRLTSKYGPSLVTDSTRLENDCIASPMTVDDWPFNFAVTQSLPRTYLYCLTLLMIAMMLGTRALIVPDQAVQRPPVLTRRNLKLAALGIAFSLLQAKAVMTLGYNFGLTWDIAVFGSAAVLATAALASFAARGRLRVPGWLFWPVAIIVIAGEWFVDYQDVPGIGQPIMRFCLSALTPLLPFFFAACAVCRNVKASEFSCTALGMFFCGTALGVAAETVSFATGISALDFVAVSFCLVAILLSIPAKRSAPNVEVKPA